MDFSPLFQYGIAGAVVATFLFLIIWIARVLVHRFIAYMQRTEDFMLATVKAIENLTIRIVENTAKVEHIKEDITAITRLRNISKT